MTNHAIRLARVLNYLSGRDLARSVATDDDARFTDALSRATCARRHHALIVHAAGIPRRTLPTRGAF